MTELPKKIIVNRIPYSVCNSNDPYSYEADPGVQEIRVTQEAAPARKRQYFMWEVAHLLLVSAGMPQKEADKYHAGVGSVLNRLVIDNDTDFVKGRKPVPSMIWINGLPYTIQQGIFKELQDEDLGGRVTYDTLYIQIMEDLKPDIKSYVVVHEITHAVLFEANAGNYDSKETFVVQLQKIYRKSNTTTVKPSLPAVKVKRRPPYTFVRAPVRITQVKVSGRKVQAYLLRVSLEAGTK